MEVSKGAAGRVTGARWRVSGDGRRAQVEAQVAVAAVARWLLCVLVCAAASSAPSPSLSTWLRKRSSQLSFSHSRSC
eukprot:4123766-Pleurochrysis_carterae.AAC.1